MAAAHDPVALVAAPVNTAPGAEYGDATRRFQGIPGLERSPAGRLFACWYAGGVGEGPDNYVLLVESHDDGASWSAPTLVVDPPGQVRAYDPCLWTDPLGRLWLFWAQSYGWWDGRAGVWCIRCDQPDAPSLAWTAPRRICDGIMMNKPTVLSDGDWLLPAAVWDRPASVTDPVYALAMPEAAGSAVWASSDQGETFTLRGKSNLPNRSFDEHMVVERADGSLWMLVRLHDGIGESVSTDRGRSWSAGRRIDELPHTSSRFFCRRLSDGRLLLVKHEVPAGAPLRRSHLTARVSDDEGRTWSAGLLLDERGGVSYPDGVEAPDGRIYIIYDFDRTGAKEIRLAVFTAADAAAGRDVSGQVRLRLLVNQATGEPVRK